jgi:hypothetical protein
MTKAMPHKDLTVPQDETFTGGLCLITMDPESHFIILEQLARARDQASWNAGMALALAPLHCRVIPSTSDEAPGLLASVEHSLEAQHFPDLLHGQHELVKAVSGPMATKERAAHQAVTEATEQLERLQHDPQSLGEEVDKRRSGRAPTAPSSLEHAAQALEAAPCEHQRLAEQRQLVQASLRGMGQDDHLVDLERGVRRNGQLIVSDISGHLDQMRTVAQQAGLSQSCVERMHKTPCGRTRRGDRLGPSPQLSIRANCLNLNQKKCKFLYD